MIIFHSLKLKNDESLPNRFSLYFLEGNIMIQKRLNLLVEENYAFSISLSSRALLHYYD